MLGRESGNRRSRYIAFRVADKHGELITAVAEIDPNENESPFPWGTWYHERAPEGDFEKVPRNYREMGLNEGIAKAMIDLIKAGRSLPREFVAGLPLVF